MNFQKRTDTCGNLRMEDVGRHVVLNGWIHRIRNLGGLVFIDLRDRYGITQLFVYPEDSPELAERAKELRPEFVIWATGAVNRRENVNPNLPTGLIEIKIDDFGIINRSELPPFEISNETETSEEIKLRYRYLDLRRQSIQNKLILRNKMYQIIHKYYEENDFIEIETPVLMKSTPEGARDFLVPSRINKGRFYALPQSPQIFKQILMISGFDRYMQIVKCFRDEDLRSDRQPEFTQVDVEMSFIDENEIISVTEGLLSALWKEILGLDIQTPFLRMSFHEAMTRYGSDKPDIRFGMEIKTITGLMMNTGFKVFSDTISGGGTIALINAKGCAGYSRKQLDQLQDFAKKYGAKGLAWMKQTDGQVNSPIAKFLSIEETRDVLKISDAESNDLLLIISDSWNRCLTALGALRLEIARQTGILESVKNEFAFLWITEFPLLEFDPDNNRWIAMHHPFTSPLSEDLHLMDSQPAKIRARAYDIVVNGAEIGGGSIRIHQSKVQQKMFELLGMSPEDAENKFGFLLKALKYGAPPHGGIALGLDRLAMTLSHTDNIRDVIAFPKTTSGLSLMDGSPSKVDTAQLNDLGLKLME